MTAYVDDGYIKFSSERVGTEPPACKQLDDLIRVRTALFDRRLVGVYPNGVGFGNLSVRASGNQFVITGSATGIHRKLKQEHFCLVESFFIEENRVVSRGPMHASSESMTHGAIYAANRAVNCVLHVHSRVMFDTLLQQAWPATPAAIPYGTPAMASAVTALVTSQPGLPVLFVMAGHDEGIIAYGADLASTLALLLGTFNRTLET